jgi:TRAP-type C4-dicarboxylate transport system permease large subunit
VTDVTPNPEPLAAGGKSPPPRSFMNYFIDTIEMVAAIFVGIVAADIFISVLLRYFFAVSIPDSYDFYGLITQQDIGKLFMAGILPGLLAVSRLRARSRAGTSRPACHRRR